MIKSLHYYIVHVNNVSLLTVCKDYVKINSCYCYYYDFYYVVSKSKGRFGFG